MCYGGHELRCVMDGGGNNCIEEGLQNGQRKVSIRGSMEEKMVVIFRMKFLLVFVILKLLN
jgi:hypothetical protein